MIINVKKYNMILGLLVIAFFIVSLSLTYNIQSYVPTIPDGPIIIEIEEHSDILITHGSGQWPLGCAECHFKPVYGECTDCHIPDFWVGENNATYNAHHDLSYGGFRDCWSTECHNPDPNDVRYVDTDLVDGDTMEAWHLFCSGCHDDRTHYWPKP